MIEVKKNPHTKVIKANQKAKKRQNPKSRSEWKKQKSLVLRTLAANQDCFLSPTLVGLLPN